MSRPITQPINQVKLTNVAVVRYHCQGKRFEIACYRNKVLDYRAGLENDLSEVLQTDRIFTNVSKGQFAKTADLQKAFGVGVSQEAICQIILDQGKSLQVSDLERHQVLENTVSQIATWVADNCVHTITGRPYTVSQIKQALGKNYQVQSHKALKKQYLDAVKFLKTVIPIERAKMELSLQYPVSSSSASTALTIRNELQQILEPPPPPPQQQQQAASEGKSTTTTTTSRNQIIQEIAAPNKDGYASFLIHVDPSLYRPLNELAQRHAGARLEIIQQVVQNLTGDVDLEQELETRRSKAAAAAAAAAATTPSSRTFVNLSSTDATRNKHLLNDKDYVDEEAVQLVEKLKSVRIHQDADESEEKHPVVSSKQKVMSLPYKSDDDDNNEEEEEEENDHVEKQRQAVESGSDVEGDSSHSDQDNHQENDIINNNNNNNGDDDDDDLLLLLPQPARRKNQRKAQKKQNKKSKRIQQQQQHASQQQVEDDLEEETNDVKNKQQQQQQQQQQASAETTSTQSPTPPTAAAATTTTTTTVSTAQTTATAGGKSCNTCGGSFASAAAYRAHYRSDWHRFNQKLKLKGIPPVSEQEFQLCDADTFFGHEE